MKKNFTNPEIKIEAFEMGMNITTLSGYELTGAENNVYTILGVEVKDSQKPETGYVYSINTESAN